MPNGDLTTATGGSGDEMAKSKMTIRTSVAFVIWAVLITAAFAFTGFKPAAQFGTYAVWLTIGLSAYTGKRLLQKKKEFNGNQ